MGADNTFGETNFNPDKQCTCTPTDLQPFGECVCGAEGSSRDFDKLWDEYTTECPNTVFAFQIQHEAFEWLYKKLCENS